VADPTKSCRDILRLLHAAGGEATLAALFAPRAVPSWAAQAARRLDDAGLVDRVRQPRGGWTYRLTAAGGAAAGGGKLELVPVVQRLRTQRAVGRAHKVNTAAFRGRRVFRSGEDAN
jgi:hypothetical protein